MSCEHNIQFVSSLLSKLHIASHIVDDPDNFISSEIDKGLRAMLFGENDYSKLLLNSPTEAAENTIYRFLMNICVITYF